MVTQDTKSHAATAQKSASAEPSRPASTKGRETKKAEASEDAWTIMLYPLLTEKSINVVESQNKLTFVVKIESTKKQIKWAVENALSVKVEAINTLIDREGKKRAMVKLTKDFKAADIATRFGMI